MRTWMVISGKKRRGASFKILLLLLLFLVWGVVCKISERVWDGM